MFLDIYTNKDDSRLIPVQSEPFFCAVDGFSFMARKDVAHELKWLEEGLQKLKENGDYHWLCNIAETSEWFNNFVYSASNHIRYSVLKMTLYIFPR